MNSIQKKRLTNVLVISNTILLLLWLFSFINFSGNKYSNPEKHSILKGQKDIVKSFCIETDVSQRLDIRFNGVFWQGCYFNDGQELFFPCDSQVINNFFNTVCSPLDFLTVEKDVYSEDIQITEKKLSPYGLDKKHCISITFSDLYDNEINSISFGNLNSSGLEIFVMTNSSKNIFKIASGVTTYLNISPTFWADPQLLPSSVFPKLSGEKIVSFKYSFDNLHFYNSPETAPYDFLPYRHGSVLLKPLYENPKVFTLQIDDGTGNLCRLDFYPYIKNGTEYFETVLSIQPAFTQNEEVKDFLRKMNYTSSISQWTFNKIKELTVQN